MPRTSFRLLSTSRVIVNDCVLDQLQRVINCFSEGFVKENMLVLPQASHQGFLKAFGKDNQSDQLQPVVKLS